MTDPQVSFILDGREVQAPPGTTVLEAARKLGHPIPPLFHHVCRRHGECDLERPVGRLGITDGSPVGLAAETFTDRSSTSVSLLGDHCLACGRCVALCDSLGWGALRHI